MVIMPVIHIMPKQTDTGGHCVIINMSTKSIFLSKHFLAQTYTESCEIMTSSALAPVAVQVTFG